MTCGWRRRGKSSRLRLLLLPQLRRRSLSLTSRRSFCGRPSPTLHGVMSQTDGPSWTTEMGSHRTSRPSATRTTVGALGALDRDMEEWRWLKDNSMFFYCLCFIQRAPCFYYWAANINFCLSCKDFPSICLMSTCSSCLNLLVWFWRRVFGPVPSHP